MYKLKITKYKHLNNNNYFDNRHGLSNNPHNFIMNLQLDYPNTTTLTKVYYKWYHDISYQGRFFEIYSDAGLTNYVSGGYIWDWNVSSGNYHSMIIYSSSSYNITGRLIFFGEISDASTFTGEIELNPNVVDYIELTKLPNDFISSLSEEIFNSDNQYVASDYTITLTNLTDELSNLGDNIFDFFENDDTYIYRVIFSKDNLDVRVGFIDYSSMDKNLNMNNDGQRISFNVFSAEQELKYFANDLTFLQIGYSVPDIVFGGENDTFNQILTKIANTLGTTLNDTVDIDTNYKIITSDPDFPRIDPTFTGQIKNENLWNMFIGFCKELALLFKIEYDELNIDKYDKLILKIFKAEDGQVVTNINIKSEIEGNKGIDMKNINWGIKTRKAKNQDNPNDSKEYYDLTVRIPEHPYAENRSFGLDKRYLEYGYWTTQYPWFENDQDSDFIWIDIPMLTVDVADYTNYTNYKITGITPLSIFTHRETIVPMWNNNMAWMVQLRYDYLLTNLKKTKRLKIVFTDFFDLSLYNKIYYNNKYWYIEKISNIDIYSEELEIEIVEI